MTRSAPFGRRVISASLLEKLDSNQTSWRRMFSHCFKFKRNAGLERRSDHLKIEIVRFKRKFYAKKNSLEFFACRNLFPRLAFQPTLIFKDEPVFLLFTLLNNHLLFCLGLFRTRQSMGSLSPYLERNALKKKKSNVGQAGRGNHSSTTI